MALQKPLPPILYVDDEKDNLTVFNSAFRRYYEIHLASSGKEGLEIMKKIDIKLIITDQRMPEMTGIEFLEKIIPDYPDCVRIILTGFSDIDAVIQAINKGQVYRYIAKPWDRDELKITIDNGLETYNLKLQNRSLIEELKKANTTLEQKVTDRTKKVESQKKEITDSIQYAGRIQNAMLIPSEDIERLLPSYFILNKPCEIVSGDYYWMTQKDNVILIAVADCTGHGVPGAFMSILGISLLNGIVNKFPNIKANEILNQLRGQVIKSLHQTGKPDETRDGMEMALCMIDFDEMKLQFSGASRSLYLIRNNEFFELKGDSMPIGIYPDEENSFTSKEIKVEKGDLIYLFSDGYVDQIGGPLRKTLRTAQLRKILMDIQQQPMFEQKKLLEKAFEDWKGDIEQVDDVMVVGIRL